MSKKSKLELQETGAVFSPCRTWRYRLWRTWDNSLPYCVFIGLNPSTADETINDPTVRRCIEFARVWGFGGLQMLNLFAFRATLPEDMKLAEDPVGPGNDHAILSCVSDECCGRVIAAWGTHGLFNGRAEAFRKKLVERCVVECLGTNNNGTPKHPLYLPGNSRPEVYWHRTKDK